MSRTAVAFDLDGTLVDLPVDIERARDRVAEILAPTGFRGPVRPILEVIDRVTGPLGDRGRALRDRARAVIDAAEVDATRRARVRPGAVELLAALRTSSIPIAIVTNNGRVCLWEAARLLGLGAGDLLGLSRDDVAQPKPDPAGLVEVARRLLPKGGELWFVGDSEVDAGAARSARRLLEVEVRCILVAGTGDGARAVSRSGVDWVVDSLDGARVHLPV